MITDDFAAGWFDFIHARLVLTHLAARESALEQMSGWLAPGGWLLVEYYYLCDTSGSPLERIGRALGQPLERTGADFHWARTFPMPIVRRGLDDVGADMQITVLNGGDPAAEFYGLTIESMRPRMVEAGLLSDGEV